MERTLQRTYAIVLCLFLVYFVKFCLSNARAVDTVSAVLIALIVGLLLYTIFLASAAQCTEVDLIAGTIALVGALVLDARLVVGAGTGSDAGGAVTAFSAVMLSAAGVVLNPKRFVAIAVGLGTVHLIGNWIGGGHDALVGGAEEALLIMPAGVAAFFLVVMVREVAARSDVAHEDAIQARLNEITLRERESALRVIQRVLHDDVIAALRSVEMTTAGTDRSHIVATCERAAAAVSKVSHEASDNSGSLEDLIRGYVVESPLDIEVCVDDEVAIEHLTPEVIVGLVGGAGEALRNVERHSGQRAAELHMMANGNGVVLEVVDQGRGFDTNRVAGFGIESSIIGRMNDIGGTAAIVSQPGRTVVRLAWDPESTSHGAETAHVSETGLAATYRATVGVVEDLRRPYRAIGIPMVFGNITLASIYSYQSDHPIRSFTMMFVVTFVAVLTYRRLVRGPLNAVSVAGHAAMIWLVIATGLLFAPDGALLGFESWIVGFAGIPLTGLVFVLPWRWAAAILAGTASLVFGIAVVDPVVGPGNVVTAIVGPVLIGGFGVLLGMRLRELSRRAKEQEIVRAEAESVTAKRIVWRQLQSAQLRSLDEGVTPFLSAVGRGALDPTAQGTRKIAAELSAEVRDNLSVPGLLDRDLRSAIRDARRRGCTVDIRASDLAVDNEFPRALELIRAAVSNAARLDHLTFSLPTTQRNYVRMVAVPADARFCAVLAGPVADMGGTIVGDNDATVLTVPAGDVEGADSRVSVDLRTVAGV